MPGGLTATTACESVALNRGLIAEGGGPGPMLNQPAALRRVHFVAGLPMTAKDTIDKKALRARYRDP